MSKPSTPPAWVAALLDTELSSRERVLLGLLARYQGRNNCAWPSRSMLATDLGTSERTVERLIASLVRKGRLAVSRPERQGRGQRNRYTVHPAREGRQSCPPSDTSKGDTDVPLRDEKGRQSCRKKGDKPRHVTRVYKEEQVSEKVNKGRPLKKFTPPTPRQVEGYAWELGYTNFHRGDEFVECYAPRRWRDTNGRPVKDWRAKLRAVWLKDLRKPQRGDFDWLPTLEELEKIDAECRAYDARLGLGVTT